MASLSEMVSVALSQQRVRLVSSAFFSVSKA